MKTQNIVQVVAAPRRKESRIINRELTRLDVLSKTNGLTTENLERLELLIRTKTLMLKWPADRRGRALKKKKEAQSEKSLEEVLGMKDENVENLI